MGEFIVLGAGMAGIGAALALQSRGHTVTVVDRASPGTETSHGNAGVIQAEAVEPYAIPRDFPTLWSYATGRSNDVLWHAKELPNIAPALWSYFRNSAPERHRAIATIYAQLIHCATDDHAPLIEAAGANALIRKTGLGEIHRCAESLDKAATKAERIKARYDVPFELYTGSAAADAEPALQTEIAGILHWTGPWSASDPGALTRSYADLFRKGGGSILIGDASSLRANGSGWQVTTTEGVIEGSDIVVALGPWAPDLLQPFGYSVPMVFKRGYHGHYEAANRLKRPYLDAANGVVVSSMTRGLRITTGAELTGRDAARSLHQLERGRRAAGELFELGEPVADSIWHGHRPCMPDMLPMVGAAPRHKGLWFDFGHGHQGFTLGPTTGRVLADIVEGRRDALTDALSPSARL